MSWKKKAQLRRESQRDNLRFPIMDNGFVQCIRRGIFAGHYGIIMHKLCNTTAAGWGKRGLARGTHSETRLVPLPVHCRTLASFTTAVTPHTSSSTVSVVRSSYGLICSHKSCKDSCWRWPLYSSDGWSEDRAGSGGEYGILLSGHW